MPLMRDLDRRGLSLYLLQHADDPVDWYLWGDDALDRARELDRPLFLSIGYSSCHWCHVMGHESFADPQIAAIMNEHFVSVKVDREERPDVDAVYMEAVQAATGRGGWPMSVFATPDGLPFLAGTYFPDRTRHGMPSFHSVLTAVSEAWTERRAEILDQAKALAGAVAARLDPPAAPVELPEGLPERSDVLLAAAAERLRTTFDPANGGFGSAPKFPQPLLLELLMRAHVRGASSAGGSSALPAALQVVETTLEAMASGGIYDHLGGGFARYSVDQAWAVPHFEKMLYDQALVGRAYLHAWQLTGDDRWRQVLGETIEYVLRDLRDPAGGLYSAEDADSGGEEGRFYIWTSSELADILGPHGAKEAAEWYGVSDAGNFEHGATVLHRSRRGDLARPAAIEAARRTLFEARSERVRPGLDDKVLTEWNAMMCSLLAEAAGATGEERWREAAIAVAEFLLREVRRPDGRVLRSWCRGSASLPGYAADYAWLVDCCTRLGELTGEARWTDEAIVLAHSMLQLFADDDRGGLYTTGHDAPPLVVRPRDLYDGVTPAAGSIAAVALTRLGTLTGDAELVEAATRIVAVVETTVSMAPSAFPELLLAMDLLEHGPVEIAVTGDRSDLVDAARRVYVPGAVLAWGSAGATLLEGRKAGLGYVCRRGACLAPVDTVAGLLKDLAEAARA
jgi:uncharacterized protein YyaL (SSP411 family)